MENLEFATMEEAEEQAVKWESWPLGFCPLKCGKCDPVCVCYRQPRAYRSARYNHTSGRYYDVYIAHVATCSSPLICGVIHTERN